ncbi:cholesterol oxidase [Singulisphaera sp. GP187]|uniref:GMC oxidoreductase n=1 Tax=Singulisphaera sp. GP187 TaxID=1882752 RepID=UPI00092C4606|nr:GMC family oxidoreductase [Singulisphaera sp. GP187]SIO66688.1 cholesterol oxidase [Singulisphaera sp. GP187]
MGFDFDLIVIGSGFGGAITACRLAEANLKVLVLERGRRWSKETYPRKATDSWFWDNDAPERENGWIDMRVFPQMAIAQGAAVGGGSLIYASISVEAPPHAFDQGWPVEINHPELKPHYNTVARFMNVQTIPVSQWTPRTRLIKEAAEKAGYGDRFKLIEMAVSFDPDLTLDPDNPPRVADSKTFTNAQGVSQGTCVHLGNCDIGCEVYAKNTLDKNYIPWAEKHGADVRELHIVTNIVAEGAGYRVFYDRIVSGQRVSGQVTGAKVIVAAGSLGSTDLLLNCRDRTGSLPRLSPFLGKNWSSNGDFLTPAIYPSREIDPSIGPTITSAIDFLDRSVNNQSFWIEDGGWPNLVNDALRTGSTDVRNLVLKGLVEGIRLGLQQVDPAKGVMPWFAQGVDAGNGTFRLKRPWYFFGPKKLYLDWDSAKSEAAINTIIAMHKKLSTVTGGMPLVPPMWTLGKSLITPHPLGGCAMASGPGQGVVDHKCEVFGYPNLYVCDGAVFPRALGVNPSRTIGAIAERTAKLIVNP